jgi:hypothetical protein
MSYANRLIPAAAKASADHGRAIALADRFLSGDDRVLAAFEGDVCHPDDEGNYFDLVEGEYFAFTDDNWVTSVKVPWQALVVPVDGCRAIAALVLAEIGRRVVPGFDQEIEEVDPEMLVEFAVIAGGIDSALDLIRRRREVAPLEWQAARSVLFQAMGDVLVSFDRVGDRPAFAQDLRALMVLESYRLERIELTCELCRKRTAQLCVRTPGPSRLACTPCFVAVKYLPPDLETVEQFTLRDLTTHRNHSSTAGLSR